MRIGLFLVGGVTLMLRAATVDSIKQLSTLVSPFQSHSPISYDIF